jgi:spore maturation protein CgeB
MTSSGSGAPAAGGSGPTRSGPRPGAPAVTFVGNNIRGERCNQRYLVPALPFGLAIYGNNAWQAPLVAACRGKVPMEELPALYAASAVNLNAHIPDHVAFDTLNQRLYDILACGGFVISDRIDALESVFEDAVLTTDGDDDLWAKLVCSLADGDDRRRRAAKGRRLVLDRHTYAHRSAAVVEFLQTA